MNRQEARMNDRDVRSLLEAAISAFWLRPENGLMLASNTLFGIDLNPAPGQRAADFACGDGVSTFFKCGGRFDPTFDVFRDATAAVSQSEIVARKIDVFDFHGKDYAPKITTRPRQRYAFGTDHKGNLLAKAASLDFYDALTECDLNDDATAIADESLDIVYCNSIYWVSDPRIPLGQMYRKLKPGARAIFDVYTTEKRELDFAVMYPKLSPQWHEMLNRGRQQTNPGLQNERQWREIFEAGGTASVVEIRDLEPPAAAWFWNFGMRPLFPALKRMAECISDDRLGDIKAEWVNTWTDLLLPLLLAPEEFLDKKGRLRLQFVLEKKS